MSTVAALMQDIAPAFEQCREYTLTEGEVCLVFLALARLKELEKMVAEKDWEGLKIFCPTEDES